MRNIKLTIAYEGTDFLGWQGSVEGVLKGAIEQIVQEPVKLQAASRTDRGVHAEGQVMNFFTGSERSVGELKRGLNRLLPGSVVVWEVEEVEEGFHPTLDAVGKTYVYRVCTGRVQMPHRRHFSWHVPHGLDVEAMREALPYFVGTHDFAAFCNVREGNRYPDTVRTVHRLELEGDLRFVVTGESFLYKMVRNIVGTIVYVGLGKLSLEAIPDIFESRARPEAGITAPAHGLTLKKIYFLTQN